MADVWSVLSAVGSILGGVFAVATFGVAFWVTHTELPRFRATKTEEGRSQAAQTLWMATFRLSIALQQLTTPVRKGPPQEPEEPGKELTEGLRFWASTLEDRKRVAELGNALLDAWGLAELFLDKDADDAVQRFWQLRGKLLDDLEEYAKNLDRPNVSDKETTRIFEAVFEAAPTIREQEDAVRAVLRPIARHGLPAKSPPAALRG